MSFAAKTTFVATLVGSTAIIAYVHQTQIEDDERLKQSVHRDLERQRHKAENKG